MKVDDFLEALAFTGFWDEDCEFCGETFYAPEGEEVCETCRTECAEDYRVWLEAV